MEPQYGRGNFSSVTVMLVLFGLACLCGGVQECIDGAAYGSPHVPSEVP
jgi:hypothetical protein